MLYHIYISKLGKLRLSVEHALSVSHFRQALGKAKESVSLMNHKEIWFRQLLNQPPTPLFSGFCLCCILFLEERLLISCYILEEGKVYYLCESLNNQNQDLIIRCVVV